MSDKSAKESYHHLIDLLRRYNSDEISFDNFAEELESMHRVSWKCELSEKESRLYSSLAYFVDLCSDRIRESAKVEKKPRFFRRRGPRIPFDRVKWISEKLERSLLQDE